ncbi:hypothetical protein BZA70DRAFT_265333 [Myxozyma melibiosi]|uniref:Uncharacterized protein n=1 Tax=Myxozyma melibiosi TaxID=54550 RepID=A0ABR1FDT9_9ASCO
MSSKFDFTKINWVKNDKYSIVKAYREALQLQEQQKKRRLLDTQTDPSSNTKRPSQGGSSDAPLLNGTVVEREDVDQKDSTKPDNGSDNGALVVASDSNRDQDQQIRKRRASSPHESQLEQAVAVSRPSALQYTYPRSRLTKMQSQRAKRFQRPKFSTPTFWPGVKSLLPRAPIHDPVPSLANNIIQAPPLDDTNGFSLLSNNVGSEISFQPSPQSLRRPYVDSVTQTEAAEQPSLKRPIDISEVPQERKKRPGFFSANFDDDSSEDEATATEEPVLKKRRLFTADAPSTPTARFLSFDGPNLPFSPRRTGDIAARRQQLLMKEREEEKKKEEEEAREKERKKLEEEREKLERERKEFEAERKRELENLQRKKKEQEEEAKRVAAEAAAKAAAAAASSSSSMPKTNDASQSNSSQSSTGLSFNFSSGPAEKTTPTISFGASTTEKPTSFTPDITFGAPSTSSGSAGDEKKDDKPTAAPFLFSSKPSDSSDKKAESDKPAFNFGAPASSAPTLSFGNTGASSSSGSSLGGGASLASSSTTPASKPALPSFSFSTTSKDSAEKDAEKSSATAAPSVPAFSFGSSAPKLSTGGAPTFTFGQTTTTGFASKPLASGSATPTSSSSLPTFGATTTASTFGSSTAAPSIFGASTSSAPKFGASATSAAPSLSSTAAPAKPVFGSDKPGSAPSAPFGAAAVSSVPQFGSAGSASTAFGAKSSTPTFGGASASASGTSTPVFGASTSNTTGFGASSAFGSAKPTPTFSLGAPAADPAAVFGFGGSSTSTAVPATPVNKPATPSFNFGAPSADAPAPSAVFGFGASTPAPAATPANGTTTTDNNNSGNMFLAAAPPSASTPAGRKLAPMRSRRTPRR